MDWARILAFVTGMVDQELLARTEYLVAENRILKARLKGRLTLSDAERATLGEIGHRLGRSGSVSARWRNSAARLASSSSTSTICAAFYRAIFNTITTPEHISRSARTARGPVASTFPRPATSLPSRRLAVCTIATNVEPLKGEPVCSCSHPVQLPSRYF
jgi:hypothetical protein